MSAVRFRFQPIVWSGPSTPSDQRRSRYTFKAGYPDNDMGESLAVRLAAAREDMDAAQVEALTSYSTPVPLWPDGATAAAHGRRDIAAPGDRAARMIRKFLARRA